jgi:hypothetical protein
MVSRPEETLLYSAKNSFFADGKVGLLRANVRSAVRVFTGEAGVTFALS